MTQQTTRTGTGTHVPTPRRARQEAPTAPPAETPAPVVSRWEGLRWRTVLRVAASRALLAVVASLLLWSVLPLAIGWTPRVILSGSMEPRIHTGDVVVTRTVDPAQLGEGNVITTEDPDKPGKTRTHRFVERDSEGRITTKGDANADPDSTSVSDSAVLGVGALRVPYIGRPAYWISTRDTLSLGISFAAVSALVLGAWAPPGSGPASRSRRGPGAGPGPGSPTRGGGAGRAKGSRSPRRQVRARGPRARRAGAVVTLLLLAGSVTITLPEGSYAAFSAITVNPTSRLAAAATFRPYQDSVTGDSPTFYWKLDETGGTAVADSSPGRGFPGTLLSQTSAWASSTALAERPQRGLDLSVAGINSSSVVNGTPSFTVEAWFRTTSTGGGRLLGLGNASGQTASSVVDRQLYVGADGRVYFGVGAARTTLASTPMVRDGRWHHVVGTFTAGTDGMRLYLDGALQRSTTATVNPDLPSGTWRAGAEALSGWASNPNAQYFNGSLDELAVYPRALSAAEVREHWVAAAG